MPDDESYAPFWGHIEDLRVTFIRILMLIAVGVVVSFLNYQPIITYLTAPLKKEANENLTEEKLEHVRLTNLKESATEFILPETAVPSFLLSANAQQTSENTFLIPPNEYIEYYKKNPSNHSLIVLGPLEGILIALKTSFWIGAVCTSPLWMFFLLQFIAPALRKEEKRLIWPFLLISMGFIIMGCAFAFYLTIPIANTYLQLFNAAIGINMWSLTHYLNYTVFLLLANGVAFELCVLGLFAVHLGLVTAATLASKRRVAIVCAFILGALLTPPDVLTQVMLAIPLIILYECVILYARFKNASHKTA